MGLDLLPASVRAKWDVYEYRHACAILATDFPDEWKDLLHILGRFQLKRSNILTAGGRKSPIALSLNGMFASRGWAEKLFDIVITIDGEPRHSPTHHVDYYKNQVAIETEWNNKDPFYDRDLTTFRLLFDLSAISVGIILTRSSELQDIFNQLGRGASFGASTTHIGKLLPKIANGSIGGCPLLVFGITKKLYIEDAPSASASPSSRIS
jgi:hypothetical protein